MNFKTLTLPLALAGAVAAQQSENPQPLSQAPLDPFATPTLSMSNGQLWASGRHFEATFVDGRMTYTPVLGAVAPTTQTFSFSFDSATRGTATVHGDGETTSAADSLVATFGHAGSIVEQYEVRSEGLKQSFVFGRPLGDEGDLVVRGRVQTSLPFAGAKADGGLSFAHPVFGGVELGRVLGFDAEGRQVDGSMSYADGVLEMRLPASFVDTAAWPITLDPLVGTALSSNVDGFDARFPDASTNELGNVLLVFQRQFSLVDIDIRGQRIDANGNNLGGVFAISTGGVNTNAAVGFTAQGDNWLVAWEFRPSSQLENSDIRCLSVDPSGAVSTTFDLATGTADQHSPDIGSDGRNIDNECLVVWVDESVGLRSAQVTAASGGPIQVGGIGALTPNTGDRNPAISQNCGQAGLCLVAFERNGSVRATRVSINNGVLGTSILIAANGSNPDCDGDGVNGMVVFQRPEAGNPVDHDILASCVDLSPLSVIGSAVGVDTNSNSDEIEPAIGFLGPNYLITYSDQLGTSISNYDVIAVTFSPECTQCSFFNTARSFIGRQHKSIVTTRRAANPDSTSSLANNAMFFWTEQEIANNFEGNTYGHRYTAFGAGGTTFAVAPGCGFGGTLSTTSSLSVGSDLVLNLSGAAPGATAGFLLLRDPATALFACGPCQAIIPAAVLNLPVVGGSGSFTVPIPCDVTLNGGRFQWQTIVLGTIASPCPLLPGGGFSNVLGTEVGL